MKAEALLALYERVADAPEAIARLRRFVLDLAVRGKLVEQDAADEPATNSLARIRAARESVPPTARKSAPKQAQDSISNLGFELPASWLQVPLSELVRVLNGRAYKRTELLDQGKTRVLRVGNLFTSDHWYFSDLDLEADKYCGPGDLIYAWSASFGPFIWTGPRVIYHYHIWKLDLFSEADTCKRFLHLYLQQKTREIKESGHGISMVHMTKEKMERLAVPFPPLAEQHRIVAKVDELMALLDRLEAARSAREANRDRLTTASLTRLTTADTDPEALRTHARFALDALPSLTTRADQIKQLRQTILDLAVRGKLVEQDAEDEPASALLATIDTQKRAHAKASSVSRASNNYDAEVEQPPFTPPPNWRWCRLGRLVLSSDAGWSPKTENHPREGNAWGVLKVSAVSWGRFDPNANKQLLPDVEPPLSAVVERGDFLISRANTAELVARSVVVHETPPRLIMSDKIVRLKLIDLVDARYVCLVNNDADHARSYYAASATGVSASMKNVSRDVILNLALPLPPLAEQHRIVAKVDELMALCDRLEAALQATDSTRARLLEALLHEALSSRADNVIDFAEARARLRPTRSDVGSLIVQHQAQRGRGGRIKLGKCLYLAEAHCGLALGGTFGRANFGPHDEWIYTFEREAGRAGWFSFSERPIGNGNLRVEYTPGPALASKAEDARAGLGEYAAELERVLDLLAPLTAEEAEIAATLFAAWNDQLLEGATVTDEAIITEVREHWHPSKARFPTTVLQHWLGWLRQNRLVPQGQGPCTRHQATLL